MHARAGRDRRRRRGAAARRGGGGGPRPAAISARRRSRRRRGRPRRGRARPSDVHGSAEYRQAPDRRAACAARCAGRWPMARDAVGWVGRSIRAVEHRAPPHGQRGLRRRPRASGPAARGLHPLPARRRAHRGRRRRRGAARSPGSRRSSPPPTWATSRRCAPRSPATTSSPVEMPLLARDRVRHVGRAGRHGRGRRRRTPPRTAPSACGSSTRRSPSSPRSRRRSPRARRRSTTRRRATLLLDVQHADDDVERGLRAGRARSSRRRSARAA